MLRTPGSVEAVRVLERADVPAVLELLARDPVPNVFLDHRTRLTQLEQRWLGGQMWGYEPGGELQAVCHVGANFAPAQADDAAARAFAAYALRTRPHPVTLVGLRRQVEAVWEVLEERWARPRELRWDQPHLQTSSPPRVAADPGVRRTTAAQLDVLYPAAVAMHTEEVGVSPEAEGGGRLYRAQVAQSVSRGWSLSRIEGDRVLFKAEIAYASPYAAQIHGVWVAPDVRGQGIGTAGMAAVVEHVLREVAPVVSLYVNGHNAGARAAYAKVGFEQTATFSTLMF